MQQLVDLGGNVGVLPEADAVFLAGQADAGGQVGVAGAFAGHGVGHGDVDDAGVRGAGGDLHQSRGLILDGDDLILRNADAQHRFLTGRAVLHGEGQIAEGLGGGVVCQSVGLHDQHLGIDHIGIGAVGIQLDLIGDGHAVPDGVNVLGFQLVELLAPVTQDQELALDAQLLADLLGQLRVEARPVAVFVLVVHGLVVGDAHDHGALLLNVLQVGVGGGAAGGQAGQSQYQNQQQSKHLFHIIFFLSLPLGNAAVTPWDLNCLHYTSSL